MTCGTIRGRTSFAASNSRGRVEIAGYVSLLAVKRLDVPLMDEKLKLSALSPAPSERLARARNDLRAGLPVMLSNKGAGLMVMAAETHQALRLRAMRQLGHVVIVVTARRARTLKAHCYDGDIARLDVATDAKASWVNAVADPAQDLTTPMKGPFTAQRGGDATLHRAGILLAKSAHLLPSVLAVPVANPQEMAARHDMSAIDSADLIAMFDEPMALHKIASGRVPITGAPDTRVHVFRPDDGGEEHYAIEIGRADRDAPVLARLHSACFTGDLLGSLKCDCGPQLHSALAAMSEAGAGVLLYLNQEGRGIGLANKMRAYSLQDQGFDTVEANHRLGFEDDERDFRLGAQILQEMGFAQARLMTNNPAKVEMLSANGIEVVERVGLKVGRTDENTRYLDVKAAKSGHLM